MGSIESRLATVLAVAKFKPSLGMFVTALKQKASFMEAVQPLKGILN